jgi:Phytanoyl-CoA dioxygenase (PhyH)
MPKALSHAQVDDFIERGFCRLRGAFPRAVGHRVSRRICTSLGVSFDDPATWVEPRLHLKENLDDDVMEAVSPKVATAFHQLVGHRCLPLKQLGWWPVSFPGFEDVGLGHWHVEGTFPHHLHLMEQSLLPLFLFSDVHAGGTLLVPGSHQVAARILWENRQDGLPEGHLSGRVREQVDLATAVEANGEAGDVILCHPLLLHAACPNRGRTPRVMANPRVLLHGPARSHGFRLSPVETVLRRARPAP